VRELARVEAGKIEFRSKRLDLNQICGEVNDILRPLARMKKLKILTTIDPDLTEIFGTKEN